MRLLKNMQPLIEVIPCKQLKEIFSLYIHYSIETSWSTLLKSKANYKNYFEPIARGEFYGFNDISKDSIWQGLYLFEPLI